MALEEAQLTLNKVKCEFRKRTLIFFGHIFSEKGMTPDLEKISVLTKAEAPNSSSDLRSFLGLASYCTRYIRDFASVSEPLRALAKLNSEFVWSTECQVAFQLIKDRIADAKNMAYFDPRKTTELIVGPVGLGAILF
ncbi:uncharacterized protein [Ambystoma mexicanum]|uniref:uncharacterized protein n=1 Tax=Ambystoma mexicanum TaxID=8296 RepID=UPI0037E754E2